MTSLLAGVLRALHRRGNAFVSVQKENVTHAYFFFSSSLRSRSRRNVSRKAEPQVDQPLRAEISLTALALPLSIDAVTLCNVTQRQKKKTHKVHISLSAAGKNAVIFFFINSRDYKRSPGSAISSLQIRRISSSP